MCNCNENMWCVECQLAELDEHFGYYNDPSYDLEIANDVWEQPDDANGERGDAYEPKALIEFDIDDLPF